MRGVEQLREQHLHSYPRKVVVLAARLEQHDDLGEVLFRAGYQLVQLLAVASGDSSVAIATALAYRLCSILLALQRDELAQLVLEEQVEAMRGLEVAGSHRAASLPEERGEAWRHAIDTHTRQRR